MLKILLFVPFALVFYSCLTSDLGYYGSDADRSAELSIEKGLTVIAFDQNLVDWKTKKESHRNAVIFIPTGEHSLTVAWNEPSSSVSEYGEINYLVYKTTNIVYTFRAKRKYRLAQRRYQVFPISVLFGPEILETVPKSQSKPKARF